MRSLLAAASGLTVSGRSSCRRLSDTGRITLRLHREVGGDCSSLVGNGAIAEEEDCAGIAGIARTWMRSIPDRPGLRGLQGTRRATVCSL